MASASASKPIERALRTAAIALALILVGEWVLLSAMTGEVQPIENTADMPNEVTIDHYTSAPVDSFGDSIERSLFAWNRKPRNSGNLTGEEENSDPEEWQLSGVIAHFDRRPIALFFNPESQESVRLEEEMFLGSWQVDTIEREAVTLVDGDQKKVIQLQTADIAGPDTKEDPGLNERGVEADKQSGQNATAQSGQAQAEDQQDQLSAFFKALQERQNNNNES